MIHVIATDLTKFQHSCTNCCGELSKETVLLHTFKSSFVFIYHHNTCETSNIRNSGASNSFWFCCKDPCYNNSYVTILWAFFWDVQRHIVDLFDPNICVWWSRSIKKCLFLLSCVGSSNINRPLYITLQWKYRNFRHFHCITWKFPCNYKTWNEKHDGKNIFMFVLKYF